MRQQAFHANKSRVVQYTQTDSNGMVLMRLVFHWSIGANGTSLVPVVRLVPMELHLVDWCSIGEMHISLLRLRISLWALG